MRLTPLTASLLIACGTSAPPQPSSEVGSAAEALRQLGKNDAEVVRRCERIVDRCEAAAADSGSSAAACDELSEHCTELAAQLSEARRQFEECLERVAVCEQAATDPAECRAERRACNPTGLAFESRRGATLACAERTQSCLPRGPRGRGAAVSDRADAGAERCDAAALDFVACCHGRGGGRGHGAGDAGAGKPLPSRQRADGSGRGPRAPQR